MNDLIWYFAYGSNMKEARLKDRDVHIYKSKPGYVKGYSFYYNKIGVDETGKGNIMPESKGLVWGVFFKLLLKDYQHLHDTYEVGYSPIEIEGLGNKNKEVIRAKSFTALPKNIDDAMISSTEYHEIVISGAREKGLPEEYISNLKDRVIR